MDYSVIRAPMDGVIGKINLRAGAFVGPTNQTAITTVSDVRELYAFFTMNESEDLNYLALEIASIKETIIIFMQKNALLLPLNYSYLAIHCTFMVSIC